MISLSHIQGTEILGDQSMYLLVEVRKLNDALKKNLGNFGVLAEGGYFALRSWLGAPLFDSTALKFAVPEIEKLAAQKGAEIKIQQATPGAEILKPDWKSLIFSGLVRAGILTGIVVGGVYGIKFAYRLIKG